jgi:hypothetical protein
MGAVAAGQLQGPLDALLPAFGDDGGGTERSLRVDSSPIRSLKALS